jgi:pimeloyl-ACP methyl ester carboxylesterase
VVVLVPGCALRDLHQQVQMLERACIIQGSVQAPETDGERVVVALQSRPESHAEPPIPVDYTIADDSGGYSFRLAPGDYLLLAFLDENGNLALDDLELAAQIQGGDPVHCEPGGRRTADVVELTASDRKIMGRSLSFERDRSVVKAALETAVSIGQLTAFGEVVPLDDERFDLVVARDSLWRPMDFVRAGYSGVYLHEALDPDRVPVLFIHGINGSPRVLSPLIERLDTSTFQPMYYYYASGLAIGQVASHLYRIMQEIEVRNGIDHYHVVAHSMGGLVARSWLLERARRGESASIGGLITLSAPWGGYDSARQGVKYSPVIAPVWRDLATGSDFLAGLFDSPTTSDIEDTELPGHHLLFSYRLDGWMTGTSGDGVATLESMLPVAVQRQADSIFGVNAGHVDILESEAAQARFAKLLDALEARYSPAD